MQFAPPMANGYGPQPGLQSQAPWIQSSYTYTAEPEQMNANFHIVPSQSYPPQQQPQQQQFQHPDGYAYRPSQNGYAAKSASLSPNYGAPVHSATSPSASSNTSLSPSPLSSHQPRLRPPAKAAPRVDPAPKFAAILPSPPSSNHGDGARSKQQTKKRKNASADREDSESADEDTSSDDGGVNGHQAPANGNAPRRPAGACTYCRRVKMKCEFQAGADKCKRCRSGNHNCVVEGRKPRRAPSKREYLLAQLRQKDGIIESLLKQLHNPYSTTKGVSTATVQPDSSEADQHRQDVVAWLDQLQSSVRNPIKRSEITTAPSGVLSNRSDSDDENAGNGIHLVNGEDAHPTLVDSASPLGIMASAALGNLRQGEPGHRQKRFRAEDEPDSDSELAPAGIADYDYFVPGPSLDLDRRISLTDKYAAPDLVVHGIIDRSEIDGLFDIFHTRVNPFMGVLDSRIHSPQATYSRCPLLFTTVCAIALRFSDRPADRPVQFPLAMHFAKKGAAEAIVDGWKSAEVAQAYIFLSLYSVPSRKLEEDRSRIYASLAVRIASDLNVRASAGKKPRDEAEALEIANHRRLWMACYTLDKQTAATFGEQSTVREGSLIGASPDGFSGAVSGENPFDIHLTAKLQLMRDLTRFHGEIYSDTSAPEALNEGLDLREIVLRYDTEFMRTNDQWTERFQRDSDKNNAAAAFRCKLLPYYVGSTRLVILSFMLQHAFRRGLQHSDEVFFKRALDVGCTVINIMLELIAPTGYLRYAPDCYFVYCTFASALLLKLLRHECRPFIRENRERDIYSSIERLIDTFGSSAVAIDNSHTPRLHAEFLSKLLAKHRKDTSRPRSHSPQSLPSPASSASSGTLHSNYSTGPVPPPSTTYIPVGLGFAEPLPPMPELTVNGTAFSTWDPVVTQSQPTYSDAGYRTPESLPESLFEAATVGVGMPPMPTTTHSASHAMQMGSNPAYEFTFTAPPPEELKCAEEERSSVWWNDFVTPSFEWMSNGIPLGENGGQLPSPYEQPTAYMPPGF